MGTTHLSFNQCVHLLYGKTLGYLSALAKFKSHADSHQQTVVIGSENDENPHDLVKDVFLRSLKKLN